jgi:hypothetical protein
MPPQGNGVATEGQLLAQNRLCLHKTGQQAHNDVGIIDVNNSCHQHMLGNSIAAHLAIEMKNTCAA